MPGPFPPARPRAAWVRGACVFWLLAALVLPGLVLAATGPAPDAAASPRRQAQAEPDPLQVELDEITPSVPAKGRIRISGTLTNTTSESWGAVNLHAFRSLTPILDPATLTTSAALAADEFVGERIVEPDSFDTVESLAPGQSVRFSLSFPVAMLEVSENGVYWIGVHARSGEETYGRARTFIPLESRRNGPTISASVVVGLRAGVWYRSDGSLDRVGRWTRWLSAGGRLDALLDLGGPGAGDGVSFLVDPAVLAAVTRLSQGNPPRNVGPAPGTETPPPTDAAGDPALDEPVTPVSPPAVEGAEPNRAERRARDAATAWLAKFRSAIVGRDVLALPYGDLDVASAAAHDPELIAQAQARSAEVMSQLGLTATPTVAPRTGTLPPAAIAETAPTSLILLSDSAMPLAESAPNSTYSVAGRVVVVTSNGAAAGGPLPTAPDQPLALRQRLLAEAAVRLESGSEAPVVLSLPADWNPTDPEKLLEGLAQPWLSVVPMNEVVTGVPVSAVPDDLNWTEDDERAVLPDYVHARAQSLTTTAELTESVLTDQTTLVGQIRDEVLAGLSETRRPRPQESGFRLTATERALRETLAQITVEVPPALTLTSASGPMGATVINNTDLAVTVRIAAEAESGLTLESADALTLAPHSRRRVLLDVSTTRDGRYDVRVMVTSLSGEPLGAVATLPVRSAVVADGVWIGAAIGVGLLFVVVVYRIARRVRRVRAGEPVRPPDETPDDDPDGDPTDETPDGDSPASESPAGESPTGDVPTDDGAEARP